jgi:hypothetical protein
MCDFLRGRENIECTVALDLSRGSNKYTLISKVTILQNSPIFENPLAQVLVDWFLKNDNNFTKFPQ